VGGATGVLSTLGGGVIGSSLLGGGSAALNEGIGQLVTNDGCTPIDTSSIIAAGTTGIFAGGVSGGIGKSLTSLSKGAGHIPSVLQNPVIGSALNSSGTKSGLIGSVGFAAGTAASSVGN